MNNKAIDAAKEAAKNAAKKAGPHVKRAGKKVVIVIAQYVIEINTNQVKSARGTI